jgi:hypothetical protein
MLSAVFANLRCPIRAPMCDLTVWSLAKADVLQTLQTGCSVQVIRCGRLLGTIVVQQATKRLFVVY